MTMDPARRPATTATTRRPRGSPIEAYEAAADPARFPKQITREGLRPWAREEALPRRRTGSGGSAGPELRSTSFTPSRPDRQRLRRLDRARVARAAARRWAQLEREAQRAYASQGWAGFPDVSRRPGDLGCDFVRQIDARVPVRPRRPDRRRRGVVDDPRGRRAAERRAACRSAPGSTCPRDAVEVVARRLDPPSTSAHGAAPAQRLRGRRGRPRPARRAGRRTGSASSAGSSRRHGRPRTLHRDRPGSAEVDRAWLGVRRRDPRRLRLRRASSSTSSPVVRGRAGAAAAGRAVRRVDRAGRRAAARRAS